MSRGIEIIETGWRADGLFIVILEGETRAALEGEGAHEYARVLAGRRRCKTPVSAEPVEETGGKRPFRRTFCFTE